MSLNRMIWGVIASIALVAALGQPAYANAIAEGNQHNGLSDHAFRRNALTTNPAALKILRDNALNQDLLDRNDIRLQLHDPGARAVMEELVECALAPSTVVTYMDPLDNNRTYTWRGELGLCAPGLGASSWTTDGPTELCQQLVTACILSRVNALDKAIPVSLRSQPSNFFSFPPDLFALRAAVPSEERFRESPGDKDPSEGKLIGSFLGSCSTPGECNWDAAYVGKCEVGTTTKLWIQGSSACNSTQLRVCAGIHGCFPPSSGQSLPPGFPLQFPYSKHILDKTGACQSSPLEFHCPTMLPIGGYYSVMTRSSMIGSAPPTVLKGNDGIPYQATEKQVFTFPEGAFYGNLFAPNGLTGTCAVSGDSPHQLSCVNISDSCPPPPPAGYSSDEPCLPYKNVYACYSLAQQEDLQGGNPDGVAYLNDRICNQPNGNKRCFFQKPERCHYNNPTRNQQEGAHCEWSPTDGVFQDCRGGGRKYPPITTYLNDPCDLIGDTSLCTRIRESISAESNSTYMNTLAAVHDPHDDGGCSTGGGGAAQPASLAALLGLLLHRRRRPRAGQR